MVSAAQSAVDRMRQDAQRATATIRTGLVVSAGWVSGAPSTVINVDGRDFTNLPLAGELNLIPGQTVSVMRTGAQLVVIGPGSADTMPLQGTVSATGASTCQVQLAYSTGVRTVNAPWLTHYTPTIGDLVKLEWAYGTPVVVGKLSATLPNSLVPPFIPSPPAAAPTSGVATFTATDSATINSAGSGLPIGYQAGRALRAQIIEGFTIQYGCLFYGDSIRSSSVGRVAAGAPSIFVDVADPDAGLRLALHDRSDRGSPYPNPIFDYGRVDLGAEKIRGWVELPDAWGPLLMSNAWGVFFQTWRAGRPAGRYLGELNGIDVNSQSGALRIPWKNA